MEALSYLVAFFLTLYLLLSLSRIAPKIGLIDAPGGRKEHVGAVPLVGGLGMFAGFCISLLILQLPLGDLRPLLAASALLVIIGVFDDLHELSSLTRFVVQILAALLMIFWGGVRLVDLGSLVFPGSVVELGIWAVPLTIFATVGVINALNMVDGVDGLAGSISGLTLSALIVVAWVGGLQLDVVVLALLLTAVAAFLVLNLRFPWQLRARIFMGDAGSMFLGFVLAWFLIAFSQGEHRLISPVTALWLLGLPLVDTVTMMLRRVLRRRSPFAPDREHFHHILLLAGFSPTRTLAIMVAGSLAMILIGLGGEWLHVPQWIMFYLFLALFVAYFFTIRHAWKAMRFFKRSLNRHDSGAGLVASNENDHSVESGNDQERRAGGDSHRP